MRIVFGSLYLAALQAITPAQAAPVAQWPASPVRTSIETPYGVLAVQASDYVYGATLVFDGKPTQPGIKGILNIPYAYVVGKRRLVLVSQDEGRADCPASYYWVAIGVQGYRITGPFGSCSPQIRVTARGAMLYVETPDRLRPDQVDVWEFDGQRVRQQAGQDPNARTH